ncbi:MAG: protein kinase [Alistipes sp.]|nr:protein kinase [Alistipes sp.]
MKLQPETLLKNGSYRIISALGQGGFGITYLAEHIHMRRKVCIKEFFPTSLYRRDDISHLATVKDDDNVDVVDAFKDKFLKEARTISTMDNPHIVRVFDSFEENGTAYYVMEYIEGESLASIVERDGALDESTARRYITEVADALGYLHERNTLHLDVKPHNIMVRKSDDRAILIDFGLAKHYDDESGTQTTSTLGGRSHGYSPIEQYDDGGVAHFSPETDIYSLGATLYYLVTASHPPRANVVGSNGLPELPHSVSSPTRAAITAAMGFSIKQRPHTTAMFMSYLNGGAKEPQPKRKRWWLWLLLLLSVVGVVCGIALSGGEDRGDDVVVTTEAEEVVISEPEPEPEPVVLPAPILTLTSKSSVAVGAEGGSGKVAYTLTNRRDDMQLSVKSNANWVSVSRSGDAISYVATANSGESSRSAKITVTYGDESFEIVITQAGKSKPVVPEAKTYNIGDYYDENGKQGVVFEVWDGGRHGKIVSLDETQADWDSRVTGDELKGYRNGTRTYADSKSDGKANTDKIMARSDSDYFPAFKWCRAKGSSWYLPSLNELKIIYNNKSVLNATLQKYGAAFNNSYYRSSTECVDNKPEFCTWDVYMGNGYTSRGNKGYNDYVRAVSAF